MTLSVIIPAYQAARYLAAALHSVLTQTLPPDEIIVVDDGSTDGTAAIARAVPQVRLVQQSNGGAASARNHGVRVASGKWLAFLDADDLWLPDKLAAQRALFQAQPELHLVFGRVAQFHSPDITHPRALVPSEKQILTGIHAGTLLMRRADFVRAGYFEEHWRSGEFIEWYARAQDAGLKSAVLPQVVMQRRLHDDNLGLRLGPAAHREYLSVMKTITARRKVGK